jgi:hypothetical protein
MKEGHWAFGPASFGRRRGTRVDVALVAPLHAWRDMTD